MCGADCVYIKTRCFALSFIRNIIMFILHAVSALSKCCFLLLSSFLFASFCRLRFACYFFLSIFVWNENVKQKKIKNWIENRRRKIRTPNIANKICIFSLNLTIKLANQFNCVSLHENNSIKLVLCTHKFGVNDNDSLFGDSRGRFKLWV